MQFWNAESQFLVAIEYNDLFAAESILKRPLFDVDVRFKIGSNSQVPAVCVCVERGLYEMTKLLVNYGCSVNLSDDCGYTPLHFAASHQFVDIMKLLLAQRANVNCVSNYGHTPLHLASQGSSVEAIECLLKAGAKMEKRDCDGRTPLAIACLTNQTNVAKCLVENGANVNLTDNCLNSPLLLSVNAGLSLNTEVINTLLEANADPNHVNVYGQTALVTAIRRSSEHCLDGVEAVTSLARHKCNFNISDPCSYGESPLHLSISRGQDRITETLIRFGCELNKKNQRGFSPLYRLLREGKSDLVMAILAAGVEWRSIMDCCSDTNLIESLQDKQLSDLFKAKTNLFPSLKHLSRAKIRLFLGRNCERVIKELPLPFSLKNYLLLNAF